MREQVIVLPPSVDRRTASISLSRNEEAMLDTSKESRSRTVSEAVNAEQIRDFGLIQRDHKEVMCAELASAENMMPEDEREVPAEPCGGAHEDIKEAKADAEGSLAPERMRNSPSCNGEGAVFPQWGLRKRSRCSRGDTRNPASDKHKLGNLGDQSSVLCHKKVRVEADRATKALQNTSSHACKGTLKAKNGEGTKREDLCSDQKQNRQAIVLKGGPSEGTEGLPLRAEKRRDSSLHKQDQLLQQSKTCTSNSLLKDRCIIPLPGSNNSKNELVWPKLSIGLSRKEKEEDFLILKGTKLPQRPKRRPKVVERALHYCIPGILLVDISPSSYDVREKKCARKRTRGLKAMESLDSDS